MHWRGKRSGQPKIDIAYYTQTSRYDATQRSDGSDRRSDPKAGGRRLNRTRGGKKNDSRSQAERGHAQTQQRPLWLRWWQDGGHAV
jgi:hypothetical protein